MKKILLILAVIIMSALASMAQMQKGNYLVAGYSNLGIDIGSWKNNSGSDIVDESKYTEFYFEPQVGYFVMDKLSTGLFFDFYHSSDKYDNGDKYIYNKFIIGPFARYYITEFNKLWPYAEFRLGVGANKDVTKYSSGGDNTNSARYFSTRFGVGGTYMVSEKVGLDTFLGYDFDRWSHDLPADSKAAENVASDTYSSIEFNVGIVILLK